MPNKTQEFIITEQAKNQILTGLFLEKERLQHLYEENEKRITILVGLPAFTVQHELEPQPKKEKKNKNAKKS
jgi:hypothetical protein